MFERYLEARTVKSSLSNVLGQCLNCPTFRTQLASETRDTITGMAEV